MAHLSKSLPHTIVGIIGIIFFLPAVSFSQITAQINSNPDSMSIPFFPLQVGNEATYAFHYYNPYGCIAPPVANDTTVTYISRDTIAFGKHYIGLPQAGFMGIHDVGYNPIWLRTNGIDTVWILSYTNAGDVLFIALSEIQSGNTIRNDSNPWLHVDTIITGAAPFGKGNTRQATIQYAGPRWFGEGFSLDEQFGITYHYYEDVETCDGRSVTLIGGIFHSTPFGTRVGIEERGKSNLPTSLNCFAVPNPATDEAEIKISGIESNEPVQIKIVDALGRLMTSERVTPSAGIATMHINVSELSAGCYFIRSTSNGQFSNTKFVVAK